MRSKQNNFIPNGNLISLKNDNWLTNQRIAGKIAFNVINSLKELIIKPNNISLLDLNKLAEDIIINNEGIPSFKGYKGFPGSICTSVNNQLVHGIPTSYIIKEGDIVSIDVGVTYNRAIADTANTFICGQPIHKWHQHIIDATREALYNSISNIKVGSRIGIIGFNINKIAKKYGYSVITNYGGHGLDWNTLHTDPFIHNISLPDYGVRIYPGMALAIEPMLVKGSNNTKVLDDKWTVITNDISTHMEHSIFVHEDRVEIITE